jgi:uncharacterized protein (TIRG00374 family)
MLGALVLAIGVSAIVYAVLAFVADGPAVADALGTFPPATLAIMLALALGCYLVRALRWGWLMRLVGHPASVRDALYLHLSGQTMAVSPGRMGEVLKPWLARDTVGMPMGEGVALVFCERVADLLAVCILSLGGLSLVDAGWWAVVLVFGTLGVGVYVAGSSWFHRAALGLIGRQAWARRHHEAAAAMSATVQRALAWRPLALSTLASVVAWGFEGVGFYLCVRTLGFSGLDVFAGVSVYAVPTIVGAFTFLPGGIGGTEASMAGILIAVGMPGADAAAATVLTRVATLWWAVLLGWAVLVTRPTVFRRLVSTIAGADADDAGAADGAGPSGSPPATPTLPR